MITIRPFHSLAAVAVLLSLFSAPAARADVYVVDPVHSSAEFRVRHLGVSNTSGRFDDVSGTVVFDESDPSKCSVEMVVKTESVDTDNEARDKHLRGEDFFNVEKYPTMTFKSTSVKKKSDDTYEVTGDFTLLGVTKPITVTAELIGRGEDREGKALVGFESSFTIKRSEFGMDKMLGESLIGDDVKITVAVECKKK